MSDFTNQLKAQADIGKLIGEFVALKPNGNGWIGLCPFHNEKSPSFHVHAARKYFYCFGCHAHGDIYEFFKKHRNLSFPDAVAAVAERMGVAVPRSRGEDGGERAPLLAIHAAAGRFFAAALAGPEGARARAYLRERELPAEVLAPYGVGYAPEGRALTLWLEREGYSAALALRSGLCQPRRESVARLDAPPAGPPAWADLYDRFRDRLMFAIADERGQLIAFGGRRLESGDEADRKGPKYLNSPETPLYTKGRVLYNLDRARAAIAELGYTILVEGYFDCLRLVDAGFRNVVASCGTALTAAQLKPLARLARRVVINFDPDAAGSAAAERSLGLLLEEGFGVSVVVLPGNLDPDLFVRRHGAEAYAGALRGHRPFFDYLADRVQARLDWRRPEQKVEALNQMLPFVCRIHDPILRQTVAENLAARLDVRQPVVMQQLQRAVQERRATVSPPATAVAALLPSERVILRAWLEWEERRPEVESAVAESRLLEGLASAPLAERLFALGSQGLDTNAIAAGLEEADRHLLASLLMCPADEEPLTEALLYSAIAGLRASRAERQLRLAALQGGDKAGLQQLLERRRLDAHG